jgi:glycerate kinase
MTTLRVLVAPDSFKGSLTSLEAAGAIADGWRRNRLDDTIELAPIADGGDGTLDAILAADRSWQQVPVSACDAVGRPLAGQFLRRGDCAVVELADASGLTRIQPAERNPLAASTYGTGLTIAAAIGFGCRRIVLGVGGSATTDGGSGLLVALGARFLDAGGAELAFGGGPLADVARVDLDRLLPCLAEVHLTIASDVTNPLLGVHGAAATYGPQKGASAEQVTLLDGALATYARTLESAVGRHIVDLPGSGAAGGTTAGLVAIMDRFASFDVRPGIDMVMELTGFPARLAAADLVITGEGRVDAQTAFGKAAYGVARRAREAGRSCVVIGGGIELEGVAAFADLDAVVVSACEDHQGLEAAMTAGAGPVERAAERVARLVSLGVGLTARGRRATSSAGFVA